MSGKGRAPKGSVRRKQRKQSAVDLQAAGLSERRIAERLGVSKSEVHRLLAEAHFDTRIEPEKLEAARSRMREMLNQQLAVWIPRAERGDTAAALAVSRFLERLAKLDGVDAPQRTELSGPGGSAIQLDHDASARLRSKLVRLFRGDGEAAGGADAGGAPPA